MAKNFYRTSDVAFIVYDVSSRESFNGVVKWLSDIREVNSDIAHVVLLANKIDCERQVTEEESRAFAKENGLGYFEVSAAKS